MRLLIWDADGGRRLAAGGALPEIRPASPMVHDPRPILAAARRELGIDAAFLRLCAPDRAELECLGDAAGLDWRPAAMDPPAASRPPWQRPGWLRAVTAAVDARLDATQRRRSGRPEQVRHSSVTGMLRIPTGDAVVWLKAVPSIFAHEGALVAWLSTFAPASVPRVVAHTPEWWIAEPFAEAAAPPAGDPLVTMARIQLAAATRVDELRALGCSERPLAELGRDVARVAARSDLVATRARERLRATVPALRAVCDEAATLGLPATLVHSDLHAENVRATRAGWLLYDWTDACVGHPLAELAAALLGFGEKEGRHRSRAFVEVWAQALPGLDVERALWLAPAIGAAHQVVNYARIVDGIERSGGDPAGGEALLGWLEAWIRSLEEALERQPAAGR